MKLLLALLLVSTTALSQPLQRPELIERRYCGAPKRDANGVIERDPAVIYAYRQLYACPSTRKFGMGACKGWALNHPVPLACGGCHEVSNLMWMRNDAKRIVDSLERKISASTPPQPDTPACVNKAVP